ncbi:Eag protein [Cronobacter sakazakii]|nr:Eag protein [Cronobacter turicensis]KAB1475974.1 Eag protein [Cronobacter sakazakii]KAB1495165.1 Eag protein [Cronobacter sakazakii]KAB1502682.1 Eag protein [Cronobacter sakazakii]PQZ09863.1 Eag protein [Cronobacter sakazakii]
MICPKCGSTAISKETTMRGWSGDYVCVPCGYNDAKSAFEKGQEKTSKPVKWTLKEKR